jgi:hypothetical protein
MTELIELTDVEVRDGHRLSLTFSDGSFGEFDATALLARPGSLLIAPRDPRYFASCFLDAGALCWPNGLELGPVMLRAQLREQGALQTGPRAA